MTILLLGANGQVGWELRRSMLALGDEVIALDRAGADLTRLTELRDTVRRLRPSVIINAAAYTAVDQAEEDEASALKVNGEAPGLLAREARTLGALLIHYSTDYVFDGGLERPYVETDPPAPLNAYGRSKLEGERAIAQAGADWLILRTSWVFSARGRNFLRTLLGLARERERLSIVDDQIGAPTSTRLLADATLLVLHAARAERAGGRFHSEILHLSAAGATSWHGFAAAIIEQARLRGFALKVKELEAISSARHPARTLRPANSCLSTGRIAARYGFRPASWEAGLAMALDDLRPAG